MKDNKCTKSYPKPFLQETQQNEDGYPRIGSDMAMVGLRDVEKYDKVNKFQKARYISSNEAIWRILSFPIHDRYQTVVHMDVHLENGQRVYFNPNNPQRVLNQVQSP